MVINLPALQFVELPKQFILDSTEVASRIPTDRSHPIGFTNWFTENFPKEYQRPGCYLFYKWDECLYVGSSTRPIQQRLWDYWLVNTKRDSHNARKVIHSRLLSIPDGMRVVMAFPTTNAMIIPEIEQSLILLFRPTLNVIGIADSKLYW